MSKQQGIQKTFWCMLGDIVALDVQINAWLKEFSDMGYIVFSRDQFIDRQTLTVYVTYFLVLRDVPMFDKNKGTSMCCDRATLVVANSDGQDTGARVCGRCEMLYKPDFPGEKGD